jgi:DEAD/DEAH box helicase domain-containing protein
MSLNALLAHWRSDPETGPNFSAWESLPARPADLRPLPDDLPAALRDMLHAQGIFELYSHQAQAWSAARSSRNVILATGTASGKSLAYNLPVLAALLADPQGRALYLFPTKALTQDQLSSLDHQIHLIQQRAHEAGLTAAIYDGDTPNAHRPAIRQRARLVFTNPDMLHTGILPHHTNWSDFFSRLRFVVVDEAHTYRGVFGSHVANVLRRLRRVARFYGGSPQFLLASATIGNPQVLAERLIEAPVELIDTDGSARGPRHFLLYNPPVVDEALGLRRSSILEAVRLSRQAAGEELQQVVFTRTRRSVEMLLTYLQGEGGEPDGDQSAQGAIRGYRSGYLPSQRREIEKGLRSGAVRTVVATNALELGIDIGGLGLSLLVGYPGTIASARQQAGRAGRGLEPAAALMITSASPIDQFLARHPDYFFGRSPEQALLNPDHLLILLNHLRCAMFELPFRTDEGFGSLPADTVREYLDFLVADQQSHLSQDRYFWMADAYPAADISLRSASPQSYVLQAVDREGPRTVGIVDGESALWMVHPGAIYLHEAHSYFVDKLDLEKRIALLTPQESDYFTEPLQQTEVAVLSTRAEEPVAGGGKAWGELQVTTRVVGFRKLRWYTRERLGEEALDLPPTQLQTTGYWLTVSEATVERLSQDGLWSNAPNDYGPDWGSIRERVRQRDGHRCQVCGALEMNRQHEVHHKTPFRFFRDAMGKIQRERANQLDNLVTLCAECHRKVELNVRIRSGLAGLGTVLGQLAPLYLMCDPGDLGVFTDPAWSQTGNRPAVVLYDQVPAGIGFSEKLYELHAELLARALELVRGCACEDGCPSCVGPGGENGLGGRQETRALLEELLKAL